MWRELEAREVLVATVGVIRHKEKKVDTLQLQSGHYMPMQKQLHTVYDCSTFQF